MARTPPNGAAVSHSTMTRKAAAERSCITCHRRKVRCDKKRPSCTNCTRAAGVACEYPSVSERPVRGPRKTTIADVALRLSDLQRSITTAGPSARRDLRSSSHGLLAGSQISSSDNAVASESTSSPRKTFGIRDAQTFSSDHGLLSDGASSQYFDEYLLSRVLEGDPERSSLLRTKPNDVSGAHRNSPFSLSGVLSDPARTSSSPSLSFISKRSVVALWNIYCVNVEPLIRVLHVPTAEGIVFSTFRQPEDAPKDALALLHAVLFAALISLEDSEVQACVGIDRATALGEVKVQLHQNLSEADFLECPTVTVLQALAIYLTVVRSENRGQGVWNFSGLALRIAQSMGMHRDGAKLGLCPFQTESRRRLWWLLVVRDSRGAEDFGLGSPSAIPCFDTEFPLNIEDSDMNQHMATLPEDRTGWTGMTYPLVAVHILQAVQQLSAIESSKLDSSQTTQEMRKITSNLKTRLDDMLQTCDPFIPIQKAALTVASFVYKKIHLVTQLQVENSNTGNVMVPQEDHLMTACECLEASNLLWDDELMRHYRWNAASFPQTHLLLYVFWHICLSPHGPNAERAWNLALAARDIERQKQGTSLETKSSFKFVVVDRLKTRAERIRTSLLTRISNQTEDKGPDEATRDIHHGRTGDASEPFVCENPGWEAMAQDFPDWRTLVADLLNVDANEFSG